MNVIFLVYHPSSLNNWIGKLLPYLGGNNIKVFHVAKLHEASPTILDGVEMYDVSGYTYTRAYKLVKSLNPDLFVFLSFRSILELTYHRICERIGVKKIYVEHGLFSGDTLKFRSNKLKTDFRIMLKRQCSFLFTHLGCILRNGNISKEMKIFYQVYKNSDFHCVEYDRYYIFSRRSFDNYSKLFQMDENTNVTYIGYPIFNDEIQKIQAEIKQGGGVLYVHQPLIFDGLAHISYEEEKKWLLDIANRLEKQYGKFTILLHPRGDLDAYKARFEDTQISVVKAPNNFKLFADKDLIVGHYSTALLYGLYFGKPTMVLDYPSTKNDPLFAELFTYVPDIHQIENAKVNIDGRNKTYMVGEHNTFEYIARCIMGNK